MEPRRRWQRWFGQPRAADRPRQITPIPPPPRAVQLPLGPTTPCCHRPLGQLSAWQHGLGRGREGRRCRGGGRCGHGKLQGPTAFAAVPRPPRSYHSARVTRGSANEDQAREKGRPGPDAPQERHAPCAGAAGSSPGAPSRRWPVRTLVRPSRFSWALALLFSLVAIPRDAGAGF